MIVAFKYESQQLGMKVSTVSYESLQLSIEFYTVRYESLYS